MPLVRQVLHGGFAEFGLLLSGLGIGYLIDAPLAGFLQPRLASGGALALGLATLGICLLVVSMVGASGSRWWPWRSPACLGAHSRDRADGLPESDCGPFPRPRRIGVFVVETIPAVSGAAITSVVASRLPLTWTLDSVAGGLVLLALVPWLLLGTNACLVPLKCAAKMKLLVLGGTVFLGRHLVEDALARGHEVTLFNRGRSNPGLFPDVERLAGDRDGGLDALRGRRWDAVVDPSGYVPRVVRQSVEQLQDAATYVFVSTGGVYAPQSSDRSEDGPLRRLDNPADENAQAHYGELKALCEDVVTGCFGDRALVVRSGLIAGPDDPTGRFTYWALRLGRGGEVLAPGRPEREVQVIDVRDQAAWILDMAEAGRGGTFNVAGPARPLTLGGLLSRSEGPLTWVSDEFLLEEKVQPYTELPLWIPSVAGRIQMPIDRALAAGLRHRDLDETIRDTRAWAESLDALPGQTDAGGRVRRPTAISADREAELLERWHGR